MLTVYGFARVNSFAHGKTRDLRVLWALEEMGLPFQLAGMDHPANDLSSDRYVAVNPFKQLPAIDDDGIIVTESGAILLHLAEKSGRLRGETPAEKASVLRWSFVALNSLELPLFFTNILSWDSVKEPGSVKPKKFAEGWSERHLSALESWLEGREFVATDSFTVADVLMAHVLTLGEDAGLLKSFPRVREYKARCFARDAWKKTFAAYQERVKKD